MLERDLNRLPYEAVPSAAVRIFRLAWQLESWLRLMVAVELRAARQDWEAPLRAKCRNWPPKSQGSDKRLHHMATSHLAAISYLTFGELWSVIIDEQNFGMFEPYLPPRQNVLVRMEELQAIRNRVAHFREPHANDEARASLLLRDIQPGIRRFCARYNRECGLRDADQDDVTNILTDAWERVGYGIELHGPKGWLYAPEPHRSRPRAHASLAIHSHARFTRENPVGLLYRVSLSAPSGSSLDINSFLKRASLFERIVIHVLVLSNRDVGLVIPAIATADVVADAAAKFLEIARESVCPGEARAPLPSDWPETVLWPNHPLNIFQGDADDAVLEVPEVGSAG
ncbi:MAG TPA: hypothetical protein VK652_09635 [Steroidobacteraceae bacterium]|nr:hypothetical protein [Steroidobacteraceae bacterium]